MQLPGVAIGTTLLAIRPHKCVGGLIQTDALTKPRPGDEGLNFAPRSPILVTLKCCQVSQ